MRTRSGYSIIEVSLSCALLLMATVGAFAIFRFGVNSFRMLTQRAELHAESQACLVRLREDIESASHTGTVINDLPARSATVQLASGSSNQPRHVLCVPGMLDWYAPGVFNPNTGLPTWDRYYLYHASTTSEGVLTRLELNAGPHTGQGWAMFSTYNGTYLAAPPGRGTNIGGTVVVSRRALSNRLLAFKVEKSSKTIVINLKFRASGRSAAGGGQRDEILELKVRLQPRNRAY